MYDTLARPQTPVGPRMRRMALLTTFLTAALLAGTAPLAHAATKDSSSCTRNDKDRWAQGSSSTHTVAVRNGPGSEYGTKARMEPLGLVRIYCSANSKSGQRWYYTKAYITDSRTTMGWIWSGNIS